MFEPRVLLVHKIIFDLSLGGCKITSAPPVGFACECKYQVVLKQCQSLFRNNVWKTVLQGYWTCGAQLKKCAANEDCPGRCTDKTCCRFVGRIAKDFERHQILLT